MESVAAFAWNGWQASSGISGNLGLEYAIVLFALVSPYSFAENFMAKVVGVSDGDTVNVLTDKPCNSGKNCKSGKIQYRVRLAEIDTPEKKQPYGSRSKQALSDLVFGRLVKVDTVDTDRYGRLVANLYVDGKWVNAELVKSGSAWVYRQYAKSPLLFEFEKDARINKRGLWGLPEADRIPPWEWRRNKK